MTATSTRDTTSPRTRNGALEAIPALSENEPAASSAPSLSAEEGTSGRRLPSTVRAGATGLVYAGVAIATVGFAVIALSWGQVAGETEVFRQIPYVISGATTGLALVLVGLTLVNVTTKQREAIRRERQLDRLAELLGERETH